MRFRQISKEVERLVVGGVSADHCDASLREQFPHHYGQFQQFITDEVRRGDCSAMALNSWPEVYAEYVRPGEGRGTAVLRPGVSEEFQVWCAENEDLFSRLVE